MKITIVGGGIVGMTAAYLLSKEQDIQVTVIDREGAGQASAAASGIVCPWVSKRRNKTWYRLAVEGARFYRELMPQLTAEATVNPGYEQKGALILRDSLAKINELAGIIEERLVEAPEIGDLTVLSAAAIQQQFPFIAEGLSGLHVSGGARVDGSKLVAALKEVAVHNGVDFITATARLARKDNRLTVLVEGLEIAADKVLLATGAWLGEMFDEAVYCDITTQKGQLLHLKTIQNSSDWPVIMPASAFSFVPFADHVVIGASHEKNKGFNLAPTIGELTAIANESLRFAPGWETAEIIGVRTGTRAYTADYTPVLGQVPFADNAYVANGLGASGLTVGPYVGKVLVDLVLNRSVKIDLAQYPVERYLRLIHE
ncbi:NAD(P)/FAD-dependent oxidoreductase [Brochothrix campestris]|uniref:Oxidoreductase, DadA family protein n=1 Tax=Brochothrix campestris FSL F6-1037 TaxID=1265861 RepID=W7CQM7_9LIST|nr:FAD-dependent oxidoreductase [Brochothrix campestris]EUJ38021.1 oxidoreductase, DadA family protein [Brochothrix campestris FSL F6-1037]